ncbi:DUF192 domain-containing protein [Pseudooceanicola sp.]|uniref:DUF192 domain-containing protein n=1 Tax=Pseudooceanicola sp. TaxID=1914328 RepID=UPI002635D72B|nr:DUF192 domain-containing protein [Pseudooceanicola sp.]MDF1855432.1 DUF192 domain-containing protein [Pseudooceanicola sp.]
MRVLIAAFACWLAAAAAWAECREDVAELRGPWGQARFRVELAMTPEARMQGLMFRESMSAGAGMLFIYPQPQPRIGFWMKNTLIPLDILFFDASGTLRARHLMAVPGDLTHLDGGSDIQYVLEVAGGVARDMGINLGTQLRHPMIDPDRAAWSC